MPRWMRWGPVLLGIFVLLGCPTGGDDDRTGDDDTGDDDTGDDDTGDDDADMTTFDGEWYSEDYAYGFEIEGYEGHATVTNAPKHYQVGELMLVIEAVTDLDFTGEQIFTDGAWVEVTGSLKSGGTELLMSGDGFDWTMDLVE